MLDLNKQVAPSTSASLDASEGRPVNVEGSFKTRRNFLFQAAASLASLIALTPFFSSETQGDSSSKQFDPASLELAELGRLIRKNLPDQAGDIERRARKDAGLELNGNMDWETAALARNQLLISERVSAELARGELVHVGGWVLSYSEAGVALLYAAGDPSGESRSAMKPSK